MESMMDFITRTIPSLLKSRKRLVWYVFSVFIFSGTALTQQPVPDPSFRPPIKNPAYPKGKGPVVLFDEGHFNFLTISGRYRPFVELLERDGYVVRPLHGTFQIDSLRKGSILVIVTPLAEKNKELENWTLPVYSAFSDEEIEAVKRWVFGGRSLFLIAEHMPFAGAVNSLVKVFGVSFSNGYVRGFRWSRSEGELPDHPIINGRSEEERVESVSSTSGSAFRSERQIEPLLVLKPRTVSYETEKVMEFTPQTRKVCVGGWLRGAVLRFGKGRVAIFGEASMFTAQLRGPDRIPQGMNEPENKGNVQFLLSIMHWLSGLLGKE
jgi:hypothetical protein